MKNKFKVEVVIDDKYVEPQITIYANERNKHIENIISAIENVSDEEMQVISGKCDGKLGIIIPKDIIRVHTEGRKVIVGTDKGKYVVKDSISSMEEKLDEERFIRISQSEIINLYRVKHFDVSIAGTVLVEFENGESTYVARRFVKQLKSRLK